ncbi:hypothetical protein ACWF0M_02965 [Kribbella sp. NPDC055110]
MVRSDHGPGDARHATDRGIAFAHWRSSGRHDEQFRFLMVDRRETGPF